VVASRQPDTEVAPDFSLGLAPVFQFVPAHASALLENLLGMLGNRRVNSAVLLFWSDGNDCDAGLQRGRMRELSGVHVGSSSGAVPIPSAISWNPGHD
jgi:hypothetical protein